MMAAAIGPQQAIALWNHIMETMGLPRDFKLRDVTPSEPPPDQQAWVQQQLMGGVVSLFHTTRRVLDQLVQGARDEPRHDEPHALFDPDAAERVGNALHPRDLEQVHICLGTAGLSVVDPRRYAFSLLNTILGGNMSSRLFQEVREKRGLAYAVYSFIAAHVDTGMSGVYLAVSPEQALEAVELVAAELSKLTREPVDATELKGAVEYTKGSLLLASENADTQMVRAAQNEIYFGADIPLATVIDRIESATREDLLQLANDLFRRDRMVLTLLGPVDTRKDAFEKCLTSNA
jgi:predicted Zn-dependent peptidase